MKHFLNEVNCIVPKSGNMQFRLTLNLVSKPAILPVNYQYPFSAAIYRIIEHADKEYAAFLHDEGYLHNGKKFKFFTFSDLTTPFRIQQDRLILAGDNANLTIAFHVEEAASNFIKGLFINQELTVGDKISRVIFQVREVQLLPNPVENMIEEEPEVVLQPLSPLVTGRKNSRGHYDFRSPEDAHFSKCLIYNWMEKFNTICPYTTGNGSSTKNIKVKMLLGQQQTLQQRLITIKSFTPEATKIRGYTKFRLQVKAPKPMLELALNAGLGLYNAQGMGCVGVIE